MTCENPKCQKDFHPRERAKVAPGVCNDLMIQTECPHCGMGYYAFIAAWYADHKTFRPKPKPLTRARAEARIESRTTEAA